MKTPYPPVPKAQTPAAMRTVLQAMVYTNPLVHKVFTTAAQRGLSGEDLYVMLAYHAMVSREDCLANLYQTLVNKQPPVYVPVEAL